MKRIKRVIITGRRKAGKAVDVARKVMKKLTKLNVGFEVTDYFPAQEGGRNINKIKADLIIAFGGDGTMLRTFQRLKKTIPVLGVNCGNRGYMLELEEKDLFKKLPEIIKGNYVIEKKTRVKVFVDGKIAGEGLNEVAVVPQLSGRILKYFLTIDEKKIGTEADDGLMVATPTGSTAHSLSAGGSKIIGDAKVFVVVRMNPIDLNRRPLIVNDNSVIKINQFQKPPVQVIIDGQRDFSAEKEVKVVKGKNVLMVKPL